jgi:adenylate cyclase class 2
VLEIEMKCAVSDFQAVRQRLSEWRARAESPLHEADLYFNAPDRDFARTDEALRLRRIGQANRVTYKGPKRAAVAKTRTEIEVPLADGDAAADDFCRLLTHLGYRPVALVRKERVCYHLHRGGFDLEVCLDEVDELGRFVEVEIVTAEEAQTQAQEQLLEVVSALGLVSSERRSYLEMLLARREGK